MLALRQRRQWAGQRMLKNEADERLMNGENPKATALFPWVAKKAIADRARRISSLHKDRHGSKPVAIVMLRKK